MQQIFNFIFKNSNRLLFLLLLGISFALTLQSHSYQKSKVISSANFVSGNVYNEINNVEEYFSLKTQNDKLAAENAMLKIILFNKKDTANVVTTKDLQGVSKTNIILSKVIHNSYNIHENYLTINTGSEKGVKPGMGVINDFGVVGVIENTSKNYATIISVLNKTNIINAKIKNSNRYGSLIWDGKSTGFVQLINIPRLATVQKGDTIVTGGQSEIFPENINIGTVERKFTEKTNNYYTLDIKLFNDMTNLGHVYILKTKDSEEIKQLEDIKNTKSVVK
jgi:rod shape-determining protein MreC